MVVSVIVSLAWQVGSVTSVFLDSTTLQPQAVQVSSGTELSLDSASVKFSGVHDFEAALY